MPDDARIDRQLEQHYAEQNRLAAEDARADAVNLSRTAKHFFAQIDAAAARNRDFEDGFKAAAKSMRDAWHDACHGLLFAIRRDS